jgi:putative inorganic carbon (hco3(-)) transporter
VPFLLLILVNATLFLRPQELFPSLDSWPIYNVVILACFALTAGRVAAQLSTRNLLNKPITFCVVGLLFTLLISNLQHLDIALAKETGVEFTKVVIYYLLMVTLLCDKIRYRQMLICIIILTTLICLIALAHHHGMIHVPAIAAIGDGLDRVEDKNTGIMQNITRMCFIGIFGNPNDLSRILVIAMLLCIWAALENRGFTRWLFAIPFLICGIGLHRTMSRGGLLAFMAGMMVLLPARVGMRKTIILGTLIIPVMLFAFGGRQTEISTSGGTGQSRIQIWSEGFEYFKTAPIFGIGVNRYGEEVGAVAHNSFVQCYVEMGFIGGTLFTSAFFLALWELYRLGKYPPPNIDPQLWRLRPYVLAVLVSYCVGMLSSTRSYSLPTYLLLALSASYIALARAQVPLPAVRFNMNLVRRLSVVSSITLVALYLYVRFAVIWE